MDLDLSEFARDPYSTPSVPCPYCATSCEADWVDVGVGMVQCGPYHCENCGASECGPYDPERELDARECETGWYGPSKPLSPLANAVGGVPVDHKTAKQLYELECDLGIQILDPKPRSP